MGKRGKRKRRARREGEEDQRGKQGFLEGSRVLFLAVLLSRTEGHPSSCQTNRFFRPITPDFEGNTVTKRCLWPGRTELLRNGNQLRTFQRQSQFQFSVVNTRRSTILKRHISRCHGRDGEFGIINNPGVQPFSFSGKWETNSPIGPKVIWRKTWEEEEGRTRRAGRKLFRYLAAFTFCLETLLGLFLLLFSLLLFPNSL